MTHDHHHVRRVHFTCSHRTGRTATDRPRACSRRHPGVLNAAASADERRVIIDYDPELIRLADVAAIVRLGSRPTGYRDTE